MSKTYKVGNVIKLLEQYVQDFQVGVQSGEGPTKLVVNFNEFHVVRKELERIAAEPEKENNGMTNQEIDDRIKVLGEILPDLRKKNYGNNKLENEFEIFNHTLFCALGMLAEIVKRLPEKT